MIRQIRRREERAMVAGFAIPVLLNILHSLWLHQYISTYRLQGILVVAFYVFGAVGAYVAVYAANEEFKKYVPNARRGHLVENIEKLQELNSDKAWRTFRSAAFWGSVCAFFAYFWLGTFVIVLFNYST